MSKQKIIILSVIIALVGAYFVFDLGQFLSLDYIKSQQAGFQGYYTENPLSAILIYFLVYVLVTGLSLPGAAIMTLVGGALFGLFVGVIVVSFASTIGATCAFLVSRTLARDWVQGKFKDSLRAINEGVEREGAFYLFGLRLVPLFPFFVINLVMGLMTMRVRTFFWVSQLGMLPGTIVYVNAGQQLGELESAAGILSPGLLFSFILLGLFPLIARHVLDFMKSRKALSAYPRPEKFDQNMVVIGAGSAGLVTSYIAAAVKAEVTLIEKHKMGGDCLNTGCVPSKALIRSAKIAHYFERADEFGIEVAQPKVNFAKVMERVQSVISEIEPHDSIERYTNLGVNCITGEAEILDPYHVKVNEQTISTRNIVIATGARPFIPPIKGLDQINYFTSDTIWSLREPPKRLMVLGGGPIGCELAQSFNRLGVPVTQIDMAPRLMLREDEEVAQIVTDKFRSEGIEVHVDCLAKEVLIEGESKFLLCDVKGEQVKLPFDEMLLAVGRKPNTEGFGLENLGITTNRNGTIKVNPYLQTDIPNILACGDVAGPYQFTHTAAHQAWFAAVNGLFGGFKKFKVDYRVIPWATFTDPEVARVGLNELEAKEQGISYEVTRYGIDDLDRAIADEEAHGFVKVLTQPGKDKILGVTIVGYHAGELITEYISAMKHKIGLNKILGTIHIYPTLSEANKFAAGEWKRAHAPEQLLQWVSKFHSWRRGEKKTDPKSVAASKTG